MKESRDRKRLVVVLGTVVAVALGVGLLATSVFGVSLTGRGYGYGYCEGYGSSYGGGCDNPAPVSKTNAANAPFNLRGPANTGGVEGGVGSIEFNNTITLNEDPPDQGPPPPADPPGFDIQTLANYFNVTVQNLSNPGAGEKGPFDPPLEITIDVPGFAQNFPDSELIACFFATGAGATGWTSIPSLGVFNDTQQPPTLAAGASDGFYIKKFPNQGGRREIHILSNHLTVFSAFRQVKKPAGTGGGGGGGTQQGGGTTTVTPLAVSSSVKKTLTVKKNRFKVPCKVAGTGALRCAVTATAKVVASTAKKKRKKNTVIAKGSAALKNGSATVVVKLTKKGKRALKRAHGRLKVKLTIRGVGGSGVKAASTTKTVTLKQAKTKKKKH